MSAWGHSHERGRPEDYAAALKKARQEGSFLTCHGMPWHSPSSLLSPRRRLSAWWGR